MSNVRALEQLKEYLKELEWFSFVMDSIDLNEEIKKPNSEFSIIFRNIYQCYGYILENTYDLIGDEGAIAFDAGELLVKFSRENPEFKEWIEMVMKQNLPNNLAQVPNNLAQSANNDGIETARISGSIVSLVNEIRNMQFWDSEHVEDIEWQLQKYQQELLANKNLFDSNTYYSLMNDINAALHKIKGFNNLIDYESKSM